MYAPSCALHFVGTGTQHFSPKRGPKQATQESRSKVREVEGEVKGARNLPYRRLAVLLRSFRPHAPFLRSPNMDCYALLCKIGRGRDRAETSDTSLCVCVRVCSPRLPEDPTEIRSPAAYFTQQSQQQHAKPLSALLTLLLG